MLTSKPLPKVIYYYIIEYSSTSSETGTSNPYYWLSSIRLQDRYLQQFTNHGKASYGVKS